MTDVAERTSGSDTSDTSDQAEEAIVGRRSDDTPRRTYELGETGFMEVPKRWRKFYRLWKGPGDVLAPNEVQCPVCKVIIRSHREFRPGDRVYCMPCMTRMIVIELPDGSLGTEVVYS